MTAADPNYDDRIRPRSWRRRAGQHAGASGHPTMFGAPRPVVELGVMPEGGGYPVGLIEFAADVMTVTDLDAVVHLCSGSVIAPRTFDIRPQTLAACLGDVRRLPIRSSSCRWVMADPPYDREYARDLWDLGDVYPLPIVLLREAARILEPGGLVAFLSHQVPKTPPELDRVATYGVTTGPGYRIRALSILRRRHDPLELDLAAHP